MHDFTIRELINTNLDFEIKYIGYDKSYIHNSVKKFNYKNFKIYGITSAQANIMKQIALTVGAECATHRDCILGKAEKSDCILGGSISQLEKIADKLMLQPFNLKDLGEKIKQKISYKKDYSQTKIVGILNITKDSFSDGGEFYDFDDAKLHIDGLINDGADIIDIGAESTKPFSSPVTDKEQLEKLIPIVEYAKSKNTIISIDTRSSHVAEECIKLGADIINDVSGFDYDLKMVDVIAKYDKQVIIQHSKGTPETMQIKPEYKNLMDEIYLSLKNKIDYAIDKGVKKENIIIDPGLGFGKTREDNFEILRRIEELYGLQQQVLLGLSRKSMLNMQGCDNFTKDIYTTALNTLAIQKKVDFIRVHNVKLHKKLIELTSEIIL